MTTATVVDLNAGVRAMALDVARLTEDAYSYDAYTPAGWRQCCLMLALRGYGPREIEAIMRSKWTRWAGDAASNRGGRYGRFNSGTLARFLDQMIARHGEAYVARQVAELTAGTFAGVD